MKNKVSTRLTLKSVQFLTDTSELTTLVFNYSLDRLRVRVEKVVFGRRRTPNWRDMGHNITRAERTTLPVHWQKEVQRGWLVWTHVGTKHDSFVCLRMLVVSERKTSSLRLRKGPYACRSSLGHMSCNVVPNQGGCRGTPVVLGPNGLDEVSPLWPKNLLRQVGFQWVLAS